MSNQAPGEAPKNTPQANETHSTPDKQKNTKRDLEKLLNTFLNQLSQITPQQDQQANPNTQSPTENQRQTQDKRANQSTQNSQRQSQTITEEDLRPVRNLRQEIKAKKPKKKKKEKSYIPLSSKFQYKYDKGFKSIQDFAETGYKIAKESKETSDENIKNPDTDENTINSILNDGIVGTSTYQIAEIGKPLIDFGLNTVKTLGDIAVHPKKTLKKQSKFYAKLARFATIPVKFTSKIIKAPVNITSDIYNKVFLKSMRFLVHGSDPSKKNQGIISKYIPIVDVVLQDIVMPIIETPGPILNDLNTGLNNLSKPIDKIDSWLEKKSRFKAKKRKIKEKEKKKKKDLKNTKITERKTLKTRAEKLKEKKEKKKMKNIRLTKRNTPPAQKRETIHNKSSFHARSSRLNQDKST